MAKWGEGDPRWIVEEREDGKNVNNWHWSEKNATQWSKDMIKKLLIGLVVENDEFFFEIIDISKCDGEATANNRKGKVIVFYEWDLETEWKGHLKSDDNKTEFKGKICVPNLSEENDANELDISVNVEKSSVAAIKLKEFIRTVGSVTVRERLGKYIADLRTEYTKDLILPTKKINNIDTIVPTSNRFKDSINVVVTSGDQNKLNTTSYCNLELEEEFFCTPSDLYQVFLNADLIGAFTRSPATINPVISGQFSMFGDTVSGYIDELVFPTSIKLRWRHKSWLAEHFSNVEMLFKGTENGTVLTLRQVNIPDRELSTTKIGWQQHYFHAIKMTFGYGGRMF